MVAVVVDFLRNKSLFPGCVMRVTMLWHCFPTKKCFVFILYALTVIVVMSGVSEITMCKKVKSAKRNRNSA